MKKLLTLLAVLMVMLLITACGNNNGNGGTPSPSPAAPPSNGGAPEAPPDQTGGFIPDSLDNPNIHIIYWRSERAYAQTKIVNPTIWDPVWETKELFEQRFGGTVNVEFANWNDQIQRMTELQSAGQAPDLIMVWDRVMHNMIFQGALMPLTDYVTDDDFRFWDVSRDLMSWRGVPYAIPWQPYLPSMVFNRDLLDLYGQPMPDELFRNGEWTFERFAQIVQATTRYVDGNPVTMGFGSWEGEGLSRFLVSNGAALIDIDTPNGRATSGFENQAFLDTLDWLRTWGVGAQGGWVRGEDMWGWFDNGGLAFIDGKEYGGEEFPFAVGMVPYPRGPHSQYEVPIAVMPQGMGVPNGARNPEGAVVFMRMLNQNWRDVGMGYQRRLIGDDNFAMIYDNPRARFVYAFDKSTPNIDHVSGSVMNLLSENIPASTIAEMMNPEHIAAMDLVFGGN